MKNEFKITDAQIADGCNEAYVRIGHNAYFGNGFNAGVEFALKLVNGVQASDEPALPIQNVVCSALAHLVETLNKRLIHPEKDADLLMEELQEIGVYHTDDKGWYID